MKMSLDASVMEMYGKLPNCDKKKQQRKKILVFINQASLIFKVEI